MSKELSSAVVLLLLLCCTRGFGAPTEERKPTHENINGGYGCAACTALVAIVEQLAEIKNSTVVETLDYLCYILPVELRPSCRAALEFLGPMLVVLVEHKVGPDVACHALTFCYTNPGQPTCHSMIPPLHRRLKGPSMTFEEKVLEAKQRIQFRMKKTRGPQNICEVPGVKDICNWLRKAFKGRKPSVDFDNDMFSISQGLRGSSWRGKDCSDTSRNVYPGTKPLAEDRTFDSNCNGIFGVNKKTSRSYEEELCGASQPRGVAVLGDSISAHFHMPPQWLDATLISEKVFEHLILVVENEIDWPMLSTVTGHGKNNWTEVITGPIDSLYLRIRDRNRCNHRDYQNIAANGEDSIGMQNLVKTLARNPQRDHPIIVLYALIGNDVCNGYPDTVAHMTTPQAMYDNTVNTLEHLHATLPNNSHVIMMGLADARILYNSMGHRIHPVATHWGHFTYGQFYDFMNCLQISPCSGWLTTNGTLRNLTAERAEELSEALRKVYRDHKKSYYNFDLHFIENPMPNAVREWVKHGGEAWQLIEPSDGFHSNQIGQALLAKVLWREFETKHPEILGPVNPNNEEIGRLFGNQGGY